MQVWVEPVEGVVEGVPLVGPQGGGEAVQVGASAQRGLSSPSLNLAWR